MAICAISVFAAVSCIQLYACYTYNRKLKAITKGFIMLSLFWFYAVSVPDMQSPVVVAIAMSCVGDMLLINSKWLTFGGFAFFGAHVGYVTAFLKNIDFKLPVLIFVFPPLIYASVIAATVLLIRKHALKHIAGAGGYISAVCAMSYFALLQLYCLKSAGAAFVFAGSILFIASDVFLVLREFRKDIMNLKHKYVLVMSTYIFAQLFIILGIVQISR